MIRCAAVLVALVTCLCSLIMVPSSSAQSVRDSAGVRIVTYAAEDRPSALWEVGPPTLQLGGREGIGPEQFWNIAGILMLDNGSLVVGDQGSSELRFFSSQTGAHLRSVGGQGQGPGEIDVLWTIWRAGRDIVAVDAAGRASYFDSQGSFRRRLAPPISARGYRLERAGFFSSGDALAYGFESPAEIAPERTLIAIRVVRLTSDEPTYLTQYPGYVATRHGSSRPRYLALGPSIALAVLGDRFCLGFPQDYVVECFSEEGRLIQRTVRTVWPRTPVTQSDRDRYFRSREAANPRLRTGALRRALREETEFARSLPAFGRFVPGENGELWVGPVPIEADTPVLYPSPPGPTDWAVFSRDGDWIANVVLPARFWLMSAGRGYVAGVMRDENDVESLLVLPLRRS